MAILMLIMIMISGGQHADMSMMAMASMVVVMMVVVVMLGGTLPGHALPRGARRSRAW